MTPEPVGRSDRLICDGLRFRATPHERLSSRFREVVRLRFDNGPLDQSRDRRDGPKAVISTGVRAGFDALKMYRLVLKKYLPASLRRSNSLCHSFRSSAETSFFRATKSRIPCDSPLL